MKDIWKENLPSEVGYWRSVLDGSHPNQSWVANYRMRIAGIDVAYPRLHKYLDKNPKILDVGAGPLSGIGAFHKGQPIDIIAIDPLALEYENIFNELSLTPAVKTRYGVAEDLSNFGKDKFDFVYSCNALDHSYDPLLAIKNMFAVCKPGGIIRLETYANEGLHASYWGLHQWNFMQASNDLVIWNKANDGYLLSHELGIGAYRELT